MANILATEEDVKKLLDIEDFRHITKEKVIQFVSNIPNMEKDVAIKAIEQFPAFKDYGSIMVSHLSEMCNKIIAENGKNAKAVFNAYQKTLDVLAAQLEKKNITAKDRRYFAEKMVEVADKMATFDADNKNWFAGLVKYGSIVVGGALLLGAVYLGVDVKQFKFPLNKDFLL